MHTYKIYLICIALLCIANGINAQSSADGLVAHYTFDNETTDKSGNNNNGQAAGGVTTAQDRFGNPCGAMRFNGTDGYITVSNSPSLKSPSASFSVAVWFKLEKGKSTSNDINIPLFSKSGVLDKAAAKAQYQFIFSRAFGDSYSDMLFSSDISARDENYNAHPLELEQWYFLAVVYEENWVTVFLNNKLIAQAIVKKPFTPNDFNLEIGRDVTGAPRYFSGCLDDLRIYNRGLSPFEISSLFDYKSENTSADNLAITLPKNIEKNTDAGKCSATVNFAAPVAISGCGKVELKQIAGSPSGFMFNAGKNVIAYEAVTSSGKKVIDSFQITVTDKEPPVIKCPVDTNTTVAAGSTTKIDYALPIATDNCKNVHLELVAGLAPSSIFPAGTTTIRYKATDAAGNSSECSFKITVEEKKPVEVKPVESAKAEVKPLETKPIPSVPDETEQKIKEPQKPFVHPAAEAKPEKKHAVTDNIIAEQKIKEAQKPFIPPVAEVKIKPEEKKAVNDNITFEQKPKEIQKPVVQPAIEQKPKAEEKPVINDNAATKDKIKEAEKAFFTGEVPTKQEVKSELKQPDAKTVTAFKEEVKNEKAKEPEKTIAPPVTEKEEKKPKVKVKDTAPSKPVLPSKPIILDCPNSIVKHTDLGKCGATISYTTPVNKGGEGIKITQIKGGATGSFFNKGTTINTFLATDIAARTKDCSFQITIKDEEPPVFNCPLDTTIILPLNRRGIVYYYQQPSVSDNCKVDSVIQEVGSKNGCFLEVGVHPFIYKAIDASGNYQICTHSVIIKTGAPAVSIEPPKSIDEQLNLGSDSVHYEYKAETKNCLLTIFIYDDGEEDGDTVSIIFNGQVIVNRDMIRLKENGMIKRTIVLDRDNENYIISKAWNTGKYGLNTLRMDVYEGDVENEKRELRDKKPVMSKVIHSKPGFAGGMILKCKE